MALGALASSCYGSPTRHGAAEADLLDGSELEKKFEAM